MKVVINKKCQCGREHTESDAYRANDLGVWITCDCGATLLTPYKDVSNGGVELPFPLIWSIMNDI